ncbi:MAG: glycosyltransferase [Acidobacteria bacterium]|nr:glycosyltransferase [Acidobacteriota bacterium]MCA1611362.1 glycosyltransferase [Acidobacteriota bacterium]
MVVNYRQAALAAACANTLRDGFAREGIGGEIVLVDCGSGDAEAEALRGIDADRLIRLPDNRGYAGGVNAGLARARGSRLVLSNADVLFRPGALTALLAAIARPGAGAAAPICEWDPDGRVLLPPGFDPGFFGEFGLFRTGISPARDDRRFARFAREAVSLWTRGGTARHLSGAVLVSRRDVFDRVGRFDERFPFEYEETEWESRVRRAGLDLAVVAGARVRHLWGGSIAGDPETSRRRAASRRLFRQRRYGRLGRALLERAERRRRRPHRAPTGRLDEIPARPGDWVALSPHASRVPFAGADLSRPFRPSELASSLPAGEWFCTTFSGADGRPRETFVVQRS